MKKENSAKNESGVALMVSIFTLLILTLLGLSLMNLSESARTVSTNNTEASESFYIAEAGLAHAAGLLKANGKTYDITKDIPSGGKSFGVGSYVVTMVNGSASDERILTSVSYGKNNSSATVRATYKFAAPSVTAAIVINGSASINGNLQVLGGSGVVHVNGNLTLSGNNRAEKYFSASGTISAPNPQPCPNGTVTGKQPGCDAVRDMRSSQNTISVPDIKPTDFLNQADYFFVPGNPAQMPAPLASVPKPSSATIYDKYGKKMNVNSWTYNSNQGFTLNGGFNLPAGTYYAYQSSIQCNTTFGSSSNSLKTTFVADGHVSFSSGASYLEPDSTFNGSKFAVVAGGDIAINGANLNTTGTEGILYARDQFALEGGQPKIFGKIYVYNESDSTRYQANPVQRQSGSAFKASGDPQVTSNDTGGGGSATGMSLVNWNEIRN